MEMSDFNNFTKTQYSYLTLWESKKPYKNSFGDFKIEYRNNDVEPEFTSDAQNEIVKLINHFEENYNEFLEIVYSQYTLIDDSLFEALADVPEFSLPKGLNAEEIGRYIRNKYLHLDKEEQEFSSRIYLPVIWDPEHGLYLNPIEQGWEIVDI